MGKGYPSREVTGTWIEKLEAETDEGLKSGFGYAYRCMMAMHDELDARQAKYDKAKILIHKLATVVGDAYDDVRVYSGIEEMLVEAEEIMKEEQP